MKFNVDYNKVLSTPDKENEFEQMILTQYANMWPDVQLTVGSIYEGSVVFFRKTPFSYDHFLVHVFKTLFFL